MSEVNPKRTRRHGWFLLVLFFVAAAPFVPYVIMETEYRLSGTVHSIMFFNSVGILEPLRFFYIWIGLWE